MEGPPAFPSHPAPRGTAGNKGQSLYLGSAGTEAASQSRGWGWGSRPRSAPQGSLHPHHRPPKQVFARSGFVRFLFQPAQTSAPSRGHGAGGPLPLAGMRLGHRHSLLPVEPRHCGQGTQQTPALSASSWFPGPTHPTPLARPLRKETKWPSCSQVPPHPATGGPVPLSAGPCSVAPGPTRPTSFLSRARLSRPRAASRPERESLALLVSVSAREAFRARPASADCCGSGCCTRSDFWLCGRACLGEGVTQAKGWEVEGKGSQQEAWGPAWAPPP